MIASYLDKNDNLDLQAFLKNGIENFPPGQSIALQKMRVKNFENFEILASAIFTNLIKNQDFHAETLNPVFFRTCYSTFEFVYHQKDYPKITAFFSHLMHISKCKDLNSSMFEERVNKMKDIIVREIKPEEIKAITEIHCKKTTQKAFQIVWKLIHDNIEIPVDGKFIPTVYDVEGDIPSYGWSGIDEVFIMKKNLSKDYYDVHLQDTYEHESIHTYNRKAMGDLNFTTPVKNSQIFQHLEAGREITRQLFGIMPRWIELKNKLNPPTQKEILDCWNRDEEILPLCDMRVWFKAEPKIKEFGLLETETEEFYF